MMARIQPTAIIEDNVLLGERTTVWDSVHIRRGATIGSDCIVGEKSYVAYDVEIGNLCKLNACVYVCAGVTIEDECMIAAHVVFTNDLLPRATIPGSGRLHTSEPTADTLHTTVRRGVTIGANATIGPGVELGAWSMVGMGTVVTRDVPAHALVVGNPGRIVGLVARDGQRVATIRDGALPPVGTKIPCPGDGQLEVGATGITHSPSAR